jgi:hypothetical protein
MVRPLRIGFLGLLIPSLALAVLAGCGSPPLSFSTHVPPTTPPGGVPLTGPATRIPFFSDGRFGAVLVPAQIVVPAGDRAFADAGPTPLPGMTRLPEGTPLVYVRVGFLEHTRTQARMGAIFALSSDNAADGAPLYLAFRRPSSKEWNLRYAGPGKVSGHMVTFEGPKLPGSYAPMSAAAYDFAIYAAGTGPSPSPSPTGSPSPSPSPTPTHAPSPSPSPSSTPTHAPSPSPSPSSTPTHAPSPSPSPSSTPTHAPSPSPSPSVTPSPSPSPTTTPRPLPMASPTSVSLTAVNQKAFVSVTEAGYTGVFAAVSANADVATVSPSKGSKTFAITAVKAGKTSVTFTDSVGAQASVTVNVTTTGGGIH